MRAIRTLLGGAAVVIAAFGCVLVAPSAALAASDKSSTAPITGRHYPGDPIKEAALVQAETQRVYNVRAIMASARWQGVPITQPYRLVTGSSKTLVLVSRAAPYTLADLEQLLPQNFVQQPDGSYLLTQNIVVETGATLQLASPDGLVIHLSSNATGFVSIITQGGSLVLTGSSKAPIKIDSWDSSIGAVDTNTADGRAYVRVVGGSAQLSYATFDHLGFWSGLTGGLSLTGTESLPVADAGAAAMGSVRGSTILPTVGGDTPAGPLDNAPDDATPGGYSYVSALLEHVTLSNNAFGLFVNGADGIRISDTIAENNLVDGIVLHRYVTNSTINSTITRNNAVDGFAMARASTGIVINQLTANDNGRDGVSLDGGPLASGPNATGTPTGDYGNNSLSESAANSNGRYGIDVSGGTNVKISNNTADGNLMGIVVSKLAKDIVVRGNTVSNSVKHGIALFDGVTQSTISDNAIRGSDIGIYLRDSSANIETNRISNTTNHGITLIGSDEGSRIVDNAIAGSGPNAIDTARGSLVPTTGDDTSKWTNTKPFWVTVRGIFQPLTILWICLGLIVVITAMLGSGKRNRGVIQHPYASHAPLSSLTKGVVTPDTVGLEPVERGLETLTSRPERHDVPSLPFGSPAMHHFHAPPSASPTHFEASH